MEFKSLKLHECGTSILATGLHSQPLYPGTVHSLPVMYSTIKLHPQTSKHQGYLFHSFIVALIAVIAGYLVVTGVGGNEREGVSLIACMGRMFIPMAYKQIFLSQALKEVIMTIGGSHKMIRKQNKNPQETFLILFFRLQLKDHI